MVWTTHLERLYQLDKAFAVQLDKLLHEERYISQLIGLQEDELIRVVDYLGDTIRRLIRVGQSPRKCLHILHQISSTRKVLPPDYEVSGTLSLLGSNPSAFGGSSDVHRGSLSTPKEDVCIKKLRMPRAGGQEKINELLCEEAILWKYLNHPNIVPFKGVTLEPPQLVSEWMAGGELRDYIKKRPSANLINLLLGIANGLAYLHSHGVIHGDLKGPNILVDASGNARIADFGLARIVRDPSSVVRGSGEYGYTPRWTAPEMFLENPISSKESDVFSFAMVAIEVFSGEVPFHGIRSSVVPGIIMNGERPSRPTHSSLTEPMWSLIRECWNQTAKNRPGMGDAIKELKRIECLPPPKKTSEKPTQTSSPIVGYEMETPPSVSTVRPHTIKGKGPLIPQETVIVGRGTTNKPTSRPPPTIGKDESPAKNLKAGVEEGHEHRAHPKETKDENVPKELGHKKSRRDLEREGRPKRTEEAAMEAKVTPQEGLVDLSASTTVVDPWINVTSPSLPTTPKPPTQPPPKEEVKGPPVSKETKVSGGGILNKRVSRHPPTVSHNDLPASGSRVEERRGHRAPPQEAKEKDRKELGNQKDLEPWRRPTYAEMAAKAKLTPKEGQPDPSGSTTALPAQTNTSRPTTPGSSTQPPPKEGKLPSMPKETNIFGGGITNRSAPRLPLTVGSNLLASGSKVTLEEGREPQAPPNRVKDNEDRRELERKQSRRDRCGMKQNDDEEGEKNEKDTFEGPPNPSGSTAALDSWINDIPPSHPLTPKPSSRRNNNMAIPPMPGSRTHLNVEPPSHPLTLPFNLEAMTNDNQSGGQNSGLPSVVQPGPNPTGHPRGSDRSTAQIQNQSQTRQVAPPSQTPATIPPAVHETQDELPEKPWWKCC